MPASPEPTVAVTAADSTPAWDPPRRPPPGAPNVVVIVLDDTGFAHLGCFGSDIDTPNIDRLAAGGCATPTSTPPRCARPPGRRC